MRKVIIGLACLLSFAIGNAFAETQSAGNGNMGPIVTCSQDGSVSKMPVLICKHGNGTVL